MATGTLATRPTSSTPDRSEMAGTVALLLGILFAVSLAVVSLVACVGLLFAVG